MSLIGQQKRNNAFSLVEMLFVIIIVGIVVGLAAPNFSKGYSRFQLNETVDDLLSVCRWAQAMAIGQERVYALSFSDDYRSYGLTRENINEEMIIAQTSDDPTDQDNFQPINGNLGRMHKIPDKITLETKDSRIKFYPDGTIDPATIQINSPDKKVSISSTQVRGMMTKVDDE